MCYAGFMSDDFKHYDEPKEYYYKTIETFSSEETDEDDSGVAAC